jgi:uncharacterized protein
MMDRRKFIAFFSAVMGSSALGQWNHRPGIAQRTPFKLSFTPVSGPIPLATGSINPSQQSQNFKEFTIADDLILPQGYRYQVIAAWGDRVGDSRFGFNNDYLSFVETAPNQGYLAMNFEYISAVPWIQGYEPVLKQKLPFADVQNAVKVAGKEGIDAFKMAESDALKQQIRQICEEALIDQGMGVISLRKTTQGQWERTYSEADRRITGISGLKNPQRYLRCTGPAQQVFRKSKGQGYLDGLGDRIIGTFGNCAGGTTPWGTVLSGEENFQNQVAEAVYSDGTPFSPSNKRFFVDQEELFGQGNVLGLAGHKYGWIVEIDPANPNDYGTKHTWLGRYRHEAVGVRADAGKPLAFYSGCDRRGGHLYKFVSRDRVQNPRDKQNSKLLAQGQLYVAKFNANGTGQWLALNAQAKVTPDSPTHLAGNALLLPKRPEGGFTSIKSDTEGAAFRQQYKTLADLYGGSPEEQQGAILIDAHYAANAIGATCTARPEDTEIAPNGSLYISFTSGSSGSEGGADTRIFKGPKGEAPYEFGFIMHLTEDRNDPSAMTFRWQMLALGGEPADGGMGFSNPDNLLFDRSGNLWMTNDMSSDKINRAVPARIAGDKPISQSDLRGIYGNNGIWVIPTQGNQAGKAFLFGLGPMECETTGPFFSRDQKTLFLSIQHPGETNGMRKDNAMEIRQFAMKTTKGQPFSQTRQVPMGSNWPSKKVNASPRPAVVAIVRVDRGAIA